MTDSFPTNVTALKLLESLPPPKVRVSRKCCAKCGERIRGTTYRFDKRTLCGLCMDDVINEVTHHKEP